MKKIDDIPGPQGLRIFSCVKGLLTDNWNEQKKMHERYGDIVLVKYPQKRVFVYHPDISLYNHSKKYYEVQHKKGMGEGDCFFSF